MNDVIPTAIGKVKEFESHGDYFYCKKVSATTWSLGHRHHSRLRFGTKEQITEDIKYVMETGKLPPRSGEMW